MRSHSHSPSIINLAVVFLLLAIIVIPIQVSASQAAQEQSPLADRIWVRLGGPIGGLGYDIRMRPDNPDIMYVTDAWSGIHKSTDGGRTWFTINEGIQTRTGSSGDAIPVFSATIDPNNNNILWIGMQNLGGLYRSEDGGQSWQKRVNGVVEQEGLSIRGISVEPGNSEVVYAAGEISSWKWAGKEKWGREFDCTRGVVYKTTDGGAHWKAIWRGDNLARYILIDPNDHNILYISTGIFDREAANSDVATDTAGGEGVLKSVDGGRTWVNMNNGLGNLYVGSLFMHPRNSQVLLAATGNNAYPEGGGVYLTVDGGANWKHVAGKHVTSVEFAASNPDIAYAGGAQEFFRSEDGGETWQSFVSERGWGWGPAGIRPGFPIDFQVDPRDPYRIFVNNYGGGNFLSEDGGETWVSSSLGYTGADLREVFVFPGNPAYVLANGRSGPFVSLDGGVNWQGMNPLEVREIAEGARIVVDPSDSQHILLSAAQGGNLYESIDGGQAWNLAAAYEEELYQLPVEDTNKKFQGFQAITFAPSDPKIVYGGFGIWRCVTMFERDMCEAKTIVSLLMSENGGSSWTRVNETPFDGRTVSEIIVHPTNPNAAWVATLGAGIFYTEDRGQTWQATNQGLKTQSIMDLVIDPTDPNILFAGTADRGVFKSEDGGASWKSMSKGMDANEPITALALDPARPQVIYAGSYRSGVFLSEDGGARWQQINNGLLMRAVMSLSLSRDGETLYAGTTGGGVFRLSAQDQAYFDSLAPTPTVTPPTLIPTSPIVPSTTPAPPTPKVPFCGGVAFLPLGLVLFAGWKRTSRK